jgi:hypothetical protein
VEGEQLDDLDSILSDEGSKPDQQPAPEVVQGQVQEEATGVESGTPPPPQEDAIETHRKGLETAVVAERRKRQEAEQRAQALEARIAEYTKTQQPQQQQDGPPDPAQFQDNPQDYWRLLARYEAREEMKADKARQEQEQQQRKQQEHIANFQTAASKAVDAGKAEFPDFDAVVNSGLAPFMNQIMQQALVFTPNGHKVAYYLGKNPGEAARIAQMEPAQMLMELGEMRAKVAAPKRVELPQTLTQERNAQGRFVPADDIPTLEAIFARK